MKRLKHLLLIPLIFLGQQDDQVLAALAFELTEDLETKVYLEGEFRNGDLLWIETLIEDADVPVFGSSFNLNFEEEKLDFLRYEPGDFLERGGDPFYLVTEREEGGELVVGQTLRNNDEYPVGEGSLIRFYFQILVEDNYLFEFDNAVVSTIDVVRQDLDNVVWENTVISRDETDGKNDLSTLEITKGDKGFGLGLRELNIRSIMWFFPLVMLFSTLLYWKIKEKKRHV